MSNYGNILEVRLNSQRRFGLGVNVDRLQQIRFDDKFNLWQEGLAKRTEIHFEAFHFETIVKRLKKINNNTTPVPC